MANYNVTVAGKNYQFDLTEPTEKVSLGHPAKYLTDRYKTSTETYLNRYRELMETIAPVRGRVVEICGGVGLFPLTLWDLLKPTSWTCYDLDPWCQANYVSDKAKFVLRDMRTLSPQDFKGAKLVIYDYESILLSKLIRRTEGLYEVIANIVAAKPPLMAITDVGEYWCHMPNHHPIYQEYFKRIPTRESYPQFFAEYCLKEFGYEVMNHTIGGGAGYYTLRRVK